MIKYIGKQVPHIINKIIISGSISFNGKEFANQLILNGIKNTGIGAASEDFPHIQLNLYGPKSIAQISYLDCDYFSHHFKKKMRLNIS